MIYPMVPFPVTLSDPELRFQGHSIIFMPIDALSVLCAQLTRDLLAIAKFLLVLCLYLCFAGRHVHPSCNHAEVASWASPVHDPWGGTSV